VSEEGEHAFVVVEVIDGGLGMSVDVMERAAGPFFTTKEVGNGRGWAKPGVQFLRSARWFRALAGPTRQRERLSIHLPAANREEVRTGPCDSRTYVRIVRNGR